MNVQRKDHAREVIALRKTHQSDSPAGHSSDFSPKRRTLYNIIQGCFPRNPMSPTVADVDKKCICPSLLVLVNLDQ